MTPEEREPNMAPEEKEPNVAPVNISVSYILQHTTGTVTTVILLVSTPYSEVW
jgi:hypothetical protein